MVIDVKVKGACVLDPRKWNDGIIVACLQGDPADVSAVREKQEGLRYDAGAAILQKLPAHGAGTHWTTRGGPVQAQVATSTVVYSTPIGTCRTEILPCKICHRWLERLDHFSQC